MRPGRRLLGALPPFLVGLAGAGVAEISATLLLYSDEGFLPALTLILTVETGALALGLWSGLAQNESGGVEQVRRRWLFALVTFSLAAAFSTGMVVLEGGLRGGLGQGFGLAFLGSLPLFALGSLLGAMARVPSPQAPSLGVSLAVGLATGFLLTGWILIPNLAPYTLYLILLSILSGGALLHGWALDGGPQVEVLEALDTPRGEARVEDRVTGGPDGRRRVILEGDRLRAQENEMGRQGREWESAVLAALEGEGRNPGSLLYLGGGGGTLARLLLESFPDLKILVVEESREVVHLARKHFYPFPDWGKVQLLLTSPFEALSELEGPFPLLLLDLASVPSLGKVPKIPPRAWEELVRLSGPAGLVVLGGMPASGALGEAAVEGLLDTASAHFTQGAFYDGEGESLLLLSGPEAPEWSPILPGFHVTASRKAEGS